MMLLTGFVASCFPDVVVEPFVANEAARSHNAEAEKAERERQEECERATRHSCEIPEAAALRREREAALDHRANARALTKTAVDAARVGDCVKVIQIDATMRAFDVDFHDAIFVRDAEISPCLATSSSTTSTSPGDPPDP
jgi:hypothetical protein